MNLLIERRRWLVAAAGLATGAAAVAEAPTALPFPQSLPDEAGDAARHGDPLVLLVSLPGCVYCEQARRGYLLPLREARGGGVLQVDVDSARTLVDFDAARRSHEAFARERRATFTPTVLFLDLRGTEIAERLVGFASADFYGAYLDQRVESARRTLAARPRG